MANWILIFNDDPKKFGTLVNLDLIPTIRKDEDGSILITVNSGMTIKVEPGQASDRCWDMILNQTAHKKA